MKSKEPHFIVSKMTMDECVERTGLKLPKFKDVTSLDHDKYLKHIKSKDALLICSASPIPSFPDNLQGECAECGQPIYYRPYNQTATKKVCEMCGVMLIEKEKKNNEMEIQQK